MYSPQPADRLTNSRIAERVVLIVGSEKSVNWFTNQIRDHNCGVDSAMFRHDLQTWDTLRGAWVRETQPRDITESSSGRDETKLIAGSSGGKCAKVAGDDVKGTTRPEVECTAVVLSITIDRRYPLVEMVRFCGSGQERDAT